MSDETTRRVDDGPEDVGGALTSGERPASGVGLCLSGGGYRAMLFHVGALRRLNEAGRLSTLTRVASVSGGSIAAGVLGRAWSALDFDGHGVARQFEHRVERPLFDLAGHTIDVRAVVTGLRPGRIATKVVKAYDRRLFDGATLQDLPADADGPRFIILATNLSNATLWRFSRPYMRDWRTEPITNPTLPLAHAVAASSAFPPVLSPCWLDVRGTPVALTDGGVYDNLGLEPVVKNCATVFVSDGGGTFSEPKKPPTGWARGTVRVLQVVDVEVRRLRRRQVIAALSGGDRDGAFWAINSLASAYTGSASTLPAPKERTLALSATPTRLAKMDRKLQRQVANWGYAVADAALRTYVDPALAEPSGFPYEGGVG